MCVRSGGGTYYNRVGLKYEYKKNFTIGEVEIICGPKMDRNSGPILNEVRT